MEVKLAASLRKDMKKALEMGPVRWTKLRMELLTPQLGICDDEVAKAQGHLYHHYEAELITIPMSETRLKSLGFS